MSLSPKQKQQFLCFFECLEESQIDGIWGKQSKEATIKLQRKLGIEDDGLFGAGTEEACFEALLSGESLPDIEGVIIIPPTGDFWDEIEFFDKEEMRCKCGGKYCDGFPHEIQPLLMQILDRARRWSGHPIVIISGLRCEEWNRIQGGVANSQHKYGEAVDVYFYGKTPAQALAWLQSQPDVRYAYLIKNSNNIHFDIHKVNH